MKKFFSLVATLLSMALHVEAQTAEGFTKYLFAYFPSNSNENIYYAVADKGSPFNFTVLNEGNAMIKADTIALKRGLRDPHILRGHDDGFYYMVATDMKSDEGWSSNRGLVLMRSRDLVNWEHHTVHFPTRYAGTDFSKVTRVWAPETIWDPEAGKYMVYFSLLGAGSSNQYDKVYYCYTNDDFSDLEGEPKWMYDRGSATIDMNIIRVGDTYHGFYKNENAGGLGHVTATSLTGRWTKLSDAIQQTNVPVEGVGAYKLIDDERYVVMYDCYTSGYYQFCSTIDFVNFTVEANTRTSGAFTPRHGNILPITEKEYETIVKWTEDVLSRNTAAVAGASLNNPVKTTFVSNGSCDNGTAGWTSTTGAQNIQTQSTAKNNKEVPPFYENWKPSNFAGKMYQKVTRIPNGTYELSITAFADHLDDVPYVYAGAKKVMLTATTAENYHLPLYVDNNQLEFGLAQDKAARNGSMWMGLDNVVLTYFGPEDVRNDVEKLFQPVVDSDYAEYSDEIPLGEWNTTNHTTLTGQHWDGSSSSSYHEQQSGWALNSWSMEMTQRVTLSPGKYVLKAAGRAASALVDARMKVDDKSVLFPCNKDYGRGIDTSGKTNWTAEGRYANSGKGRGWEWRYLPFEVKEEGEHTFTISASTVEGIHQWASICNIKLLKVPDGTGLENVESECQKSSTYNLQGMQQSPRGKGIVIKEGKKMLKR